LSYGCLVVFLDCFRTSWVTEKTDCYVFLFWPSVLKQVQLVVTVYVTEIRNRCNCREEGF